MRLNIRSLNENNYKKNLEIGIKMLNLNKTGGKKNGYNTECRWFESKRHFQEWINKRSLNENR